MFQKTSIEGVSSVKPARNKIESDYSICSHLKRLIPVCGFIQLSCMMSFICKKKMFFFYKIPLLLCHLYCHAYGLCADSFYDSNIFAHAWASSLWAEFHSCDQSISFAKKSFFILPIWVRSTCMDFFRIVPLVWDTKWIIVEDDGANNTDIPQVKMFK